MNEFQTITSGQTGLVGVPSQNFSTQRAARQGW